MNLSFPTFLAASLATTANAWGAPHFSSVYTMTNQDVNEILVYSRDTTDGSLHFEQAVSTAGSGLGQVGTAPGDPLGAQDPMLVAGRCLVAVNAGSDTVSTFRILGSRNIELAGVYPSGGVAPVSVAEQDGLLYVLNSHGDGSIQGFHIDTALPGSRPESCTMSPIGDSIELQQDYPAQPPNGLATPTEVGFTPEGNLLVVIKLIGGFETFPDNPGTATLNHYVLEDDGTTSAAALTVTEIGGEGRAGSLPFAFDFDAAGRLLLAEVFFGGAPAEGNGSGAVSTWTLNADYTYSELGVTDIGQIFTCWVRYNSANDCAYSSNAGSEGSVSALASSGGAYELVEQIAAGLNAPIDLVTDLAGENLYVLSNAVGESSFGSGIPAIHVYSMTSDSCALTSVQQISDGFSPDFIVANGAVGLAVFPGNPELGAGDAAKAKEL